MQIELQEFVTCSSDLFSEGTSICCSHESKYCCVGAVMTKVFWTRNVILAGLELRVRAGADKCFASNIYLHQWYHSSHEINSDSCCLLRCAGSREEVNAVALSQSECRGFVVHIVI